MAREIRTLQLSELETLLEWAAAEGWNPGQGDAVPFFAADPNGFFGAFVDGKMVAGISAVAYDSTFAFIGLYICRPDFRGAGHGKAVWDYAMRYLGTRTIGLDGVPAQEPNYDRAGFKVAYRTLRMTGALPSAGARPATLAAAGALDPRCFPAPRPAFIARWLEPPRLALEVDDGFGVVRQCRDGHKVGPLFAATSSSALQLLGALSQGRPVSIDVPKAQVEFLGGLTQAGFTAGFETARMYRGPAPAIDLNMVYGTTTLELG